MKILRTEAEKKTIEEYNKMKEKAEALEFKNETLSGKNQYLEHQIKQLNEKIREQENSIAKLSKSDKISLWDALQKRAENAEKERDYYKSLINEQHYNKII